MAQEFIESDGYVYRVEILGDELFYSIRQKMIASQFNYCAADGCSVDIDEDESEFEFCAEDDSSTIKLFDVSNDILQDVKNIVKSARQKWEVLNFLSI